MLGAASFSLVAAVAAYALLPLATQFVLCFVHELAHVLASLLVGFRVVEIDLGRGPARFARWWGGACVTLRPWPLHGYVRSLYRGRRWLRTRLVAVALAGPLSNLLVALAMQMVTNRCLDDGEYFTARGAALWAITLSCWMLAVAAVTPALLGGRAGWWSVDVRFAWIAARASSAQLEDGLQANAVQAAEHRFAQAFHRGDLVVAERELAMRLAAAAPDASTWCDAAWLHLARGEAAAAVAANEQAMQRGRAAIAAARANGPLPVAQRAAMLAQEQQFAIERAFFLSQRGDAAGRDEALALVASWPTERRRFAGPAEWRAAMARVRGAVLLAAAQPAAAVPFLQVAVRGHEPYWLRALAMAQLALALARTGRPVEAQVWARRARRLDPHGPLLSHPLQQVDAALAEWRASPAAIR